MHIECPWVPVALRLALERAVVCEVLSNCFSTPCDLLISRSGWTLVSRDQHLMVQQMLVHNDHQADVSYIYCLILLSYFFGVMSHESLTAHTSSTYRGLVGWWLKSTRTSRASLGSPWHKMTRVTLPAAWSSRTATWSVDDRVWTLFYNRIFQVNVGVNIAKQIAELESRRSFVFPGPWSHGQRKSAPPCKPRKRFDFPAVSVDRILRDGWISSADVHVFESSAATSSMRHLG